MEISFLCESAKSAKMQKTPHLGGTSAVKASAPSINWSKYSMWTAADGSVVGLTRREGVGDSWPCHSPPSIMGRGSGAGGNPRSSSASPRTWCYLTRWFLHFRTFRNFCTLRIVTIISTDGRTHRSPCGPSASPTLFAELRRSGCSSSTPGQCPFPWRPAGAG